MGIAGTARRAVFLDRDGVITRPIVRDGRPYAPMLVAELEVLPGVAEALGRLRAVGLRLVVVTNQPEVARGTLALETVHSMHEQLSARLPIDDFRVCPHDDVDACGCRKPEAGLLEQAGAEADLALSSSFMVGDRWRDIEAGRRAGCTTVFVDWGYAERRPERPDVVVHSLGEAADWILSRIGSDAA